MAGKPLIPLATFGAIDIDAANGCLREWGHKMGPINRPGMSKEWCHGLFQGSEIVAVTVAATLIQPAVGGGHGLPMTRDNTIELARLCAVRPGLCRVALRLWREFFLPDLRKPFAISYQDADLHSGQTYRFDGWKRIGFSHSGTDQRTGRLGRDKWIWMWEVKEQQP